MSDRNSKLIESPLNFMFDNSEKDDPPTENLQRGGEVGTLKGAIGFRATASASKNHNDDGDKASNASKNELNCNLSSENTILSGNTSMTMDFDLIKQQADEFIKVLKPYWGSKKILRDNHEKLNCSLEEELSEEFKDISEMSKLLDEKLEEDRRLFEALNKRKELSRQIVDRADAASKELSSELDIVNARLNKNNGDLSVEKERDIYQQIILELQEKIGDLHITISKKSSEISEAQDELAIFKCDHTIKMEKMCSEVELRIKFLNDLKNVNEDLEKMNADKTKRLQEAMNLKKSLEEDLESAQQNSDILLEKNEQYLNISMAMFRGIFRVFQEFKVVGFFLQKLIQIDCVALLTTDNDGRKGIVDFFLKLIDKLESVYMKYENAISCRVDDFRSFLADDLDIFLSHDETLYDRLLSVELTGFDFDQLGTEGFQNYCHDRTTTAYSHNVNEHISSLEFENQNLKIDLDIMKRKYVEIKKTVDFRTSCSEDDDISDDQTVLTKIRQDDRRLEMETRREECPVSDCADFPQSVHSSFHSGSGSRRDTFDVEYQIHGYENDIRRLNTEIDSLKRQLDSMDEQQTSFKASTEVVKSELQLQIQNLQSANKENVETNGILQNYLNELRNENSTLREENKLLQLNFNRNASTFDANVRENDHLKAAFEKIQGDNLKVKAELDGLTDILNSACGSEELDALLCENVTNLQMPTDTFCEQNDYLVAANNESKLQAVLRKYELNKVGYRELEVVNRNLQAELDSLKSANYECQLNSILQEYEQYKIAHQKLVEINLNMQNEIDSLKSANYEDKFKVISNECEQSKLDYRNLENMNQNMQKEIDRLLHNNENAEKYSKSLEYVLQENETLKVAFRQLEQMNGDFQKDINRLHHENDIFQQEIERLHHAQNTKLEALMRENEHLKGSYMEMSELNETLQEELESLKKSNASAKRLYDGVIQENASLKSSCEERVQYELCRLGEERNRLETENSRRESANETLVSEIESYKAAYAELVGINQNLQLEINSLKVSGGDDVQGKHNIVSNDQDYAKLLLDVTTENECLKSASKELEEAKDFLLNDIRRLNSENSDLKERLTKVEETILHLQELLDKSEKEACRLKTKYDELKTTHKTFVENNTLVGNEDSNSKDSEELVVKLVEGTRGLNQIQDSNVLEVAKDLPEMLNRLRDMNCVVDKALIKFKCEVGAIPNVQENLAFNNTLSVMDAIRNKLHILASNENLSHPNDSSSLDLNNTSQEQQTTSNLEERKQQLKAGKVKTAIDGLKRKLQTQLLLNDKLSKELLESQEKVSAYENEQYSRETLLKELNICKFELDETKGKLEETNALMIILQKEYDILASVKSDAKKKDSVSDERVNRRFNEIISNISICMNTLQRDSNKLMLQLESGAVKNIADQNSTESEWLSTELKEFNESKVDAEFSNVNGGKSYELLEKEFNRLSSALGLFRDSVGSLLYFLETNSVISVVKRTQQEFVVSDNEPNFNLTLYNAKNTYPDVLKIRLCPQVVVDSNKKHMPEDRVTYYDDLEYSNDVWKGATFEKENLKELSLENVQSTTVGDLENIDLNANNPSIYAERNSEQLNSLQQMMHQSNTKIDSLLKELSYAKSCQSYKMYEMLQKKMDETLGELHRLDTHCDELELELSQLLRERDALQLRLSGAIKEREKHRAECTLLDSFTEPNCDGPSDELIRKFDNLRDLNYMKDPQLFEESRNRHEVQMRLLKEGAAVSSIESSKDLDNGKDDDNRKDHFGGENAGFSISIPFFKWFQTD